MSHFYGTVQGARGEATRGGMKNSGLKTNAASWAGCIRVELYERDGKDYFHITETPWDGQGRSRMIAQGIIGEDGEV